MPEEYDGYQLTEYMDQQDLTPPWAWDDEEEDDHRD